jgi:hypothetical protein
LKGKMMFKNVLAVLAAFPLLFGALPADARERGKPADRVWMNGADRNLIVEAFLTGRNPCVGSSAQHTCYVFSPVTDELFMQQVSRPKGLGKNLVVNTILQLTPEGMVMRNEAGVILARFQVGSEQQNAAAIWNTGLSNVPAAMANGMGAGLVCSIAGCNNNGGGGSISYAIAGSEANALVEMMTNSGGCGSAPCGTPAPKKD